MMTKSTELTPLKYWSLLIFRIRLLKHLKLCLMVPTGCKFLIALEMTISTLENLPTTKRALLWDLKLETCVSNGNSFLAATLTLSHSKWRTPTAPPRNSPSVNGTPWRKWSLTAKTTPPQLTQLAPSISSAAIMSRWASKPLSRK